MMTAHLGVQMKFAYPLRPNLSSTRCKQRANGIRDLLKKADRSFCPATFYEICRIPIGGMIRLLLSQIVDISQSEKRSSPRVPATVLLIESHQITWHLLIHRSWTRRVRSSDTRSSHRWYSGDPVIHCCPVLPGKAYNCIIHSLCLGTSQKRTKNMMTHTNEMQLVSLCVAADSIPLFPVSSPEVQKLSTKGPSTYCEFIRSLTMWTFSY